MRGVLALLIVIASPMVHAAQVASTNVIAVGQGISSPTSTSTVNYSNGYTAESPLGTIYQNGARISAQYDRNDGSNSDAIGGELGYGTGEWGIAGGYRKPNCTGCEGRGAGAFGINAGGFGFGIRFAENLYSAAILLNPHGTHRLGLMGELNEASDALAKVTAYGLGYSYVASQFTFTLDASGRTFKDGTVNDRRMLVTPGFVIRADIVQLSVNDRITLNRDPNNAVQMREEEHDLWFGIGFGGDKWHLVGYSDYVNKIAVVGSLFF